jgi:hypothetical protein
MPSLAGCFKIYRRLERKIFQCPFACPCLASIFLCEYYANTLGFLELACDLLVLVFSIEPDV